MKKILILFLFTIGFSVNSFSQENGYDRVEHIIRFEDEVVHIEDGGDTSLPDGQTFHIDNLGNLEIVEVSEPVAQGAIPISWEVRYWDGSNYLGSEYGSGWIFYHDGETMDDFADRLLEFFYAL
jgi:hypothetical protein